MSDYIFPLVLAALLMVLGVAIAVQPVLVAGYVYPLALVLIGIGSAMFGAAFAVWALMAALLDRRVNEWAERATR